MAVWRHLDFYKLLWAIKERKLWLTLIREFADPFEASVPRQTKDADVAIIGNSNAMKQIWPHFFEERSDFTSPLDQSHDKLTEIARRRKALLRAAHASCWRWGSESEAMWRLYCGGNDGVAIRSTFSKLRDSIHDPHTMVSMVHYIDYKSEGLGRHQYDYDPALHKRKAFQHEQEVRVLRIKQEDFVRAGQDEHFSCDEHVEIVWQPEAVIDEIVLSPLSPKAYGDVFKGAIERISPLLAARMRPSELSEEPQY